MSRAFEYRGPGLPRCSSMWPPCRESQNVAPQTLSPVPERSQVTPDCAVSSCGTLQRSFSFRDACRALVFTAGGR
jgi:hypothetical protein